MEMNSGGGWSASDMFAQSLSRENKQKIIEQTTDRLSDNLPFEMMASPEKLANEARATIQNIANEMRLTISVEDTQEIVTQVVGQVAGFSYLYPLFQREDISEILINPNGTLWVMEKGSMDFTLVKEKVDPIRETDRVVEALLRQSARSLTEAVPTVSAKLKRVENTELPASAGRRSQFTWYTRCVCPGDGLGVHSINIRMYEQEPVKARKRSSAGTWHLKMWLQWNA